MKMKIQPSHLCLRLPARKLGKILMKKKRQRKKTKIAAMKTKKARKTEKHKAPNAPSGLKLAHKFVQKMHRVFLENAKNTMMKTSE